jgi:transposase-like protein
MHKMLMRDYIESKKRVVRAMLERGVNTTEIAEEFGVARQSMWQFIRRHNLDEGLYDTDKDPKDYYIHRRLRPLQADPDDVEVLSKLARENGVEMAEADEGQE